MKQPNKDTSHQMTKDQMDEISASIRQESGGDSNQIAELLSRTYTVGRLKKALEGLDDSLPVEVEVVLEITEEGHCTAQPGLVIHTFQVQEGDDGFKRFTLVGAQPQNAEAYSEAFELNAAPSFLQS